MQQILECESRSRGLRGLTWPHLCQCSCNNGGCDCSSSRGRALVYRSDSGVSHKLMSLSANTDCDTTDNAEMPGLSSGVRRCSNKNKTKSVLHFFLFNFFSQLHQFTISRLCSTAKHMGRLN